MAHYCPLIGDMFCYSVHQIVCLSLVNDLNEWLWIPFNTALLRWVSHENWCSRKGRDFPFIINTFLSASKLGITYYSITSPMACDMCVCNEAVKKVLKEINLLFLEYQFHE